MPNFRTIRIFISSTFRDMDFERDEIKFKVIPRLNAYYAHHGISFQAVDLRIGVNTSGLAEEVRENKVLDVCLSSIDQSRPFFIGLIGGRYGWIPPDKRFRYILKKLSSEKRPLISGAANRSVTELEILYGAIGNKGQYIDHSLFFFRAPASYKGMDSQTLNLYKDYDRPDLGERLANLRQRILEVTQHTWSEPVTYELDWDTDKCSFVDPASSFANAVFQRLSEMVEKDIVSEEAERPWYEILGENDMHIVSSYLADASDRRDIVRRVAGRVTSGSRIIMTGGKGMGKSTFLALLTDYVANESERAVLMAFPAIDSHSLSPHIIMAKWIDILSQRCGMQIPFPSIDSIWEYSLNQLREMLEKIAVQANIAPVVFIDDVSMLDLYSNDAAYLSWIPKSFGLFVTADSSYDLPALKIHLDIETISLPDLTIGDTNVYFGHWENRNSNELGKDIRDELLLSMSEPRRVALLLNLIETFASDDFQKIRDQSGDDEMGKITAYVISVIRSAPREITGLINYLIVRVVSKDNGAAALKDAIILLALSRCGLRDSDIEALLGESFDMLTYVSLMNLLKYLFFEDRQLHKRNFRSNNLLQSYIEGVSDPQPYYRRLVSHALSLPDNDPLRRDMLLFFLVQSGDIEGIVHNVLFLPLKPDIKRIVRDYYTTSMQFAIRADGEEKFTKRIMSIASSMDIDNAIYFIYNILFHGFPELIQRIAFVRRFKHYLFNIPIQRIKTARAAYALAWMQSECISIEGVNCSAQPSEKILLLKTAIECFTYSRHLDPNVGDPTNMITAMAANLIPLYAQIGDFDSMNEIISMI